MGVGERLAEIFKSAEEIVFNNSSRLILFSDCHRGDNRWADQFADNPMVGEDKGRWEPLCW